MKDAREGEQTVTREKGKIKKNGDKCVCVCVFFFCFFFSAARTGSGAFVFRELHSLHRKPGAEFMFVLKKKMERR
jgi:hypothetical protein